jgi:hypothetical protein
MANFEDERDDTAHDDEEASSASGSWNRPLLLAALGLTLMLAGYAAMNYVLAGRLALFGGLFLFVLAGVLMYRSSPPSKIDEEDPFSREP